MLRVPPDFLYKVSITWEREDSEWTYEFPNILLLLALWIVFIICSKLSTLTTVLLTTTSSPLAFSLRVICAPERRSIIFYL